MRYVRPDQPKSYRFRRVIIVVSVCIIVAGIIITAFMLFHKQQQTNLNDVSVIKTKVGKIFLLPTNEQPALATVTNSKKVSSSFAGKVKNGDKILIYQTNKRAVIYRPSINKVIDVQPVVIDDVQSIKKSE